MQKELRCPKCKSDKITFTDYFNIYVLEDINPPNDNSVTRECVGVCQACKTEIQWKEQYLFSGFYEITI